jgi:hypothetical protein
MYYAWYDANTWDGGKLVDQPVAPYISADRATIDRQVSLAQQAGIDGFALDWLGPGNPTDTNLQALLAVAQARGFHVTIVLDLNSPFIHNPGDATNSLTYASRYFGSPAWFRYGGKPVVEFYGIRAYDTATWGAVRSHADPAHAATWIGEGDQFAYLNVFDGIYPYSIAWSPDPASQLASYASRARSYPGKLWMATVMPGYDDTRLGRPNGFAVGRQGGTYYSTVWQGAIATQPDLISITSWNEWLEGTQIEPSQRYGNQYVQLTRQYSDAFHSAASPPTTSTSKGVFFPQAANGHGGYWVVDDSTAAMYRSFQSLGGVGALGYPASQRFETGGFMYQAAQGALLQWRPELDTAVLANTYDWFTVAGQDAWLLALAGVPLPIRDDGSNGDWQRAQQTRLAWLTDDAIRAAYLSVGSLEHAIQLYGLPSSYPEKHGPFVVQRFQRIALQHWVDDVPGMPPRGSVVRILAGDYLKQLKLIPSAASQPTSS